MHGMMVSGSGSVSLYNRVRHGPRLRTALLVMPLPIPAWLTMQQLQLKRRNEGRKCWPSAKAGSHMPYAASAF